MNNDIGKPSVKETYAPPKIEIVHLNCNRFICIQTSPYYVTPTDDSENWS